MKFFLPFIASVASVLFVSSAFAQVPMDFSTAGYAANERPIPNAPIRVTVSPRPGDNTARIQSAIDYVSALTPDTNGLRGAVLLLAGRHEILGGLRITNSGVVLRGQGVGNTTLVAAGLDRRTLIRVFGKTASTADTRVAITEDVPVGTTAIRVQVTNVFKSGDLIRITRPSTKEWIVKLGATEFGGGEGGGWKPGSRDIAWDRNVKSVDGNLITLDAPSTTAIESSSGRRRGDESQTKVEEKLETPYVVSYKATGRITQVGIENLTLESAFDATNAKDENHSWFAITMENTADSWVRQVTFKHFAGSAVALYETCQRITVQDCLSLAPVSEIGGYRRHTFFTMGQQTLFLRCYAEFGRHDFSVGHCAAGPNAFVQCEAREALDDSGPIESWASGVLYDNVTIDGNALTLGYRPGNNASIGWAAANCVLWNCSASVIRCWNPPGATNWSFGSWASFEGDGVWKSSNNFMSPDSLFAAQLKDRLGAEAAARLQLMSRPRKESSNPLLDEAQELAAAAHQPAPQLYDYILNANRRDPIPSEPGDAKHIEDIPFGVPPSGGPSRVNAGLQTKTLLITNGWLTMNGKPVIGSSASVAWWRGSIRPNEAANFGLGITRFVPGRIGAGFTDDLNEVADKLLASGDVALDHNYGLWYDRRRDDHERIRRIDGDVLPPFLEQPFARVGQRILPVQSDAPVGQRVPPVHPDAANTDSQDGLSHYNDTAWLGLSKYDLTQFNPWYWSRLREFADIADERGLVLFHQNYFQHNILEAGAHWADSPWRSANNINNTGFPEPPPYAGDKRIFQAELFYDVMHPVRRKLHEGYIRQCLDNFTNNANVIQFTSAEFTGPKHFVEFWLDTIAEWQSTRSSRRKEALTKSAIGNRQLIRASSRRLLRNHSSPSPPPKTSKTPSSPTPNAARPWT